jgi:hypothetical protein
MNCAWFSPSPRRLQPFHMCATVAGCFGKGFTRRATKDRTEGHEGIFIAGSVTALWTRQSKKELRGAPWILVGSPCEAFRTANPARGGNSIASAKGCTGPYTAHVQPS